MEVGDWNDDNNIGYAGFESLSKRMKESVNNVSTPTARKSQTLVPRGVPNPLSAMKNFSYKSPVHTIPTLLEQDNAVVVNCRGITPSPSTGHKMYNNSDGRNLFKAFGHSCSVEDNHHDTDTSFVKNRSKSVVVGTGGGERSSSGKGRKRDRGYTDDYWNEFKSHQRLSSTTSPHLKPVALCQLQDTEDTTLAGSHSIHKNSLLAANDADTKPPRKNGGHGLVVAKRMLLKQDSKSDEDESRRSMVVSLPSKNSKLTTTNNSIKNDVMMNKLLLREGGSRFTNQPPCNDTKQAIADESQEGHHKSLLKGKQMKQHHVYGKYNNRCKDLGSSSGVLEASKNRASSCASVVVGSGVKKDDNINKNGALLQNPAGECLSRRTTLSKQGGEYFLTRSPLRRSRRRTCTTTEEGSLVTPWKGDSVSQPVDLADSSDESAPVVREQGHSDEEDNAMPYGSSSLTNHLPGNGLEIIVLAISFKHHIFCRDMRLILKPWERTIILTDRERTSSPASCTYECTYDDTTGRENEGHNKSMNNKAIFVNLLMDELTTFRYGYVSGDDGCILLEAKDGSESLSALLNFVTASAEDQQLILVSGNDNNNVTSALPILEDDDEAEEKNHKSNDDGGKKRRKYFWLCLASAKNFDEKLIPSFGVVSCGGDVLKKNSGGEGGTATTTAEMMISVREKAERYIQASSPTVDISPVSMKVASTKLDFIAERYFQVNLCEEEKKRDRLISKPTRRTTPRVQNNSGGNNAEDDELLFAYPMNAGASDVIQIFRSDHLRLREGEFLNDNLIDFYLKFTLREDPIIRKRVMNGTSSEVHVFSSHFFPKLSEVPLRADKWETVHAPVSRWTKSFNIWATQFLFFPIAEHLHWSLAVACNLNAVERCRKRRKENPSDNIITKLMKLSSAKGRPQPCIIFMDSLRLHKPRRIAGYLRAYLTQELRSIDPNALPFTDANLPCIAPSVPTQSNGCDCGIFVIKYVDHILRTWPTISFHDVDTKLKNIINPHSFDCFGASSLRKEMKTELDTLATKYKEIQTTSTSKKATVGTRRGRDNTNK